MKRIIIILGIIATCISACHERTIGYLITENAGYEPDSLVVPRELDPVIHAIRIKNQAPWISFAMQGYEGTEQIMFSVESVTSTAGEAEARKFKNELKIRGEAGLWSIPWSTRLERGAMSFPCG